MECALCVRGCGRCRIERRTKESAITLRSVSRLRSAGWRCRSRRWSSPPLRNCWLRFRDGGWRGGSACPSFSKCEIFGRNRSRPSARASEGTLLHRTLGAIAGFLYRRADRIVVVTPAFKDHLIRYWNVPAAKISVVENGVETDLFRLDPAAMEVRKQLKLEDRFLICYIGTMGNAHGLETVIAAAEELQTALPRAHVLADWRRRGKRADRGTRRWARTQPTFSSSASSRGNGFPPIFRLPISAWSC